MKRIAIIINNRQLNSDAILYACYLASLSGSKLAGLFLKTPENEREEQPRTQAGHPVAALPGNNKKVVMDVDQAVRYFIRTCESRGVQAEVSIKGRINEFDGEVMDEMIIESRFSDLIVMDPEISLGEQNEIPPSHLLKEMLSLSECPVVLTPLHYTDIKEVAFCYDGSASSVFAIKQFACLFPQLRDKDVRLVSVTASGIMEEKTRIESWLKDHFANVPIETLNGNLSDELFTYFLMKKNVFIVMGAYGRNLLSRFFHKSAADVLMRTVDLPLFIAHR